MVTKVVHIEKESNNLDESEFLGVDDTSCETYEDVRNLDKKFKKIAPSILELNPRDVKKFGISKQTLWNIKKKIKINQTLKISKGMKASLLRTLSL